LLVLASNCDWNALLQEVAARRSRWFERKIAQFLHSGDDKGGVGDGRARSESQLPPSRIQFAPALC